MVICLTPHCKWVWEKSLSDFILMERDLKSRELPNIERVLKGSGFQTKDQMSTPSTCCSYHHCSDPCLLFLGSLFESSILNPILCLRTSGLLAPRTSLPTGHNQPLTLLPLDSLCMGFTCLEFPSTWDGMLTQFQDLNESLLGLWDTVFAHHAELYLSLCGSLCAHYSRFWHYDLTWWASICYQMPMEL